MEEFTAHVNVSEGWFKFERKAVRNTPEDHNSWGGVFCNEMYFFEMSKCFVRRAFCVRVDNAVTLSPEIPKFRVVSYMVVCFDDSIGHIYPYEAHDLFKKYYESAIPIISMSTMMKDFYEHHFLTISEQNKPRTKPSSFYSVKRR